VSVVVRSTLLQVLTPEHQVNLGAAWSKVNMRRVMARYPTGSAFTNEPGVSSNVVARDAAWFTIGCDHFMPVFSRALLDMLASLQYPSGKIPEYYNALDRKVEDYGLNINDDTPLFMHAVNHHFRSTGDLDWLRRICDFPEPAIPAACSSPCSANHGASTVDGGAHRRGRAGSRQQAHPLADLGGRRIP